MLEAMNLKVPVICTGYSGNMEFCSESTAWLVDYDEVQLGPDDYIFVKQGQKWAEPNLDDAARQFKLVYSDPAERTKRVDAAYRHVQENFSTARISMRFRTRLDEIMQHLEERNAGSET
jgi:glycosyltransferase involved in cell wall biosynthesis